MSLDASLCVASAGDARRLQRFADGLRGLRTQADWELLLVLNGAGVSTLEATRALLAGLPARVLCEPVPGKSRALNKALAEARGELLVFTDDDVTPEPQWLERLVAAARAHPGARVLGGRILPRGEVPRWVRESSNLQQLLASIHDLGPDDRAYGPGAYPIGPSMAVRRAALGDARWPEQLGPGTRCPVGDETVFLSAISASAAADRRYVAGAVVHHEVSAQYFGLAAAVKRTYLGGYVGGLCARRGTDEPDLAGRGARRLAGLRSARELACVASRALGFFRGRFLPGSAGGLS